MYTIAARITGIAPLLQHRYPLPDLANVSKGGHQQTGARDFSQEWREYLYADADGQVYQPASHIEGAMVKAAAGFRITGKRGKSYKDMFAGNVFVTPDRIMHGMQVPAELDTDPDKALYLDLRPVVVQRARVVRIRPAFKPGWELDFEISILDDQLPPEIAHDVLSLAGRTIGIGDFRPRFGRFQVTHFEAQK